MLVCDSDRQRAATIGALVGLRRHAIRLAFDVADARAECLRALPDVLLVELSLGADAESLALWLTEHAPAVRRVFVCATANEASEWLRRRMADYILLSPIDMRELWTIVDSQ